jgi:cytochrome P450
LPDGLSRVAKKSVHDRYVAKEVDHLDMMASFTARGLKETDLVAEALLQILAGADTTATAIRATMLHIITHPAVYKTLQAEIDQAVQSGRIPSPVIQEAEAQELKYLQAVIREGLRIWPPVTELLSKVVPEAGDEVEVDGKKKFIPSGTNIGWCLWEIAMNKDIFGVDANMFRPERWLINDTEKSMRMNKTVDLAFGYGKYQCLGRPVALLELSKVFVEVRNSSLLHMLCLLRHLVPLSIGS